MPGEQNFRNGAKINSPGRRSVKEKLNLSDVK
jgi:hypothetical protein